MWQIWKIFGDLSSPLGQLGLGLGISKVPFINAHCFLLWNLLYSETWEQQQQVAKLVMGLLVKDIHIDNVPEPPQNPTDIRQPRAFL